MHQPSAGSSQKQKEVAQAITNELLPVLDAISLPYMIIDDPKDIKLISRAYHHSRTFSRPVVVALTRDLLK